MNQYWTFSGAGASVTSVYSEFIMDNSGLHISTYCCCSHCSIDENVFVLEYNGTATAPSIAQTVTMPETLSFTDIRYVGTSVCIDRNVALL